MTATTQFDQVSVIKRANVYFDGKCVSHTVLFADGTRKTLGVILPGTLNFGTDAPELIDNSDVARLDPDRARAFLAGTVRRGVRPYTRPAWMVSSAHEVSHIERTLDVCADVLASMQAVG